MKYLLRMVQGMPSVGTENELETEINELADHGYSVQQIAVSEDGVVALLRLRSEEPDPEDNWCMHLDKKTGKRCLFDAVRDGYCKKHWRENAAASARAADRERNPYD